MTGSFPEIREAALAQLPADTGLDGELVVWESGRLAFERLQQRLARRRDRGPGCGTPVAGALRGLRPGPPRRHRPDRLAVPAAASGAGSLFADRRASGAADAVPVDDRPGCGARGWLEWTAAGLEGLCFKRLDEPYVRGARSWRKHKVRATTEAVVGAVTGSLAAPPDGAAGPLRRRGRLQYTGRSTPLSQAAGRCAGRPVGLADGCASVAGVDVLGGLGNTARS